jgi:hypothetical protein
MFLPDSIINVTGKKFRQLYMTPLLQEVVGTVHHIPVGNDPAKS